MSNSFMAPLSTFTLESLVTNGQWTAAQNNSRKKADKSNVQKKSPPVASGRLKETKPAL
jgi:hypothetical protein